MPWDTPRHVKTGCRKRKTLTPDLVDHLVNLTSPPEQHNLKIDGPKVSNWTILNKPQMPPR